MAAEIENRYLEETDLKQSSGGVFEVERDGELIFSKRALGRFPQEGEVIEIIAALNAGVPLNQAQAASARSVPGLPSFAQWLAKYMRR